MPIKNHPISQQMNFKSLKEQYKTRDREIENADKQLSAILTEY